MKRRVETHGEASCMTRFKKQAIVRDAVWRNVRKADESKYDFSSKSLLKTRVTTSDKGQGIKSASRLSRQEGAPEITELLMQPSASLPMPNLDETLPRENPDENFLTLKNPPLGELTSTQSELEEYVYSLKQHKAIAPCDCSLAKFVIHEYDCKNFSLKVNKFQFVARVAKYFEAEIHWAYSCSCDHNLTSLTDSLSHSLTISYDSYEQSSPNCLQAAKMIIEEFDSLHGITPNRELTDHNYSAKAESSNGFVPIGSENAVCVEVERDFGVICLDRTSA